MIQKGGCSERVSPLPRELSIPTRVMQYFSLTGPGNVPGGTLLCTRIQIPGKVSPPASDDVN